MKWKTPPDNHIVYEALTALADKRLEVINDHEAHCYSSSGRKYYAITYDPQTHAIMSNDNMAYYIGQVSYPMIAFLMMKGEISYDYRLLECLKGIPWKDINQKFLNQWEKSVGYVLAQLKERCIDTAYVQDEVAKIFAIVQKLDLTQLGEKIVPPKAY